MRFVARLSQSRRRSPRYLVQRAIDSARRRARRPWSYVYPRLVTERTLLNWLGGQDIDELWRALAQQPFFVLSAERSRIAERFRAEYPDSRAEVVNAADAAVRHEFDLLGSGPQRLGTPLPWHTDFKTGRRWPSIYSGDIEYNELDRPTDVKVPWELSRCQHFTRLGQAYWLTGEERYAAEFVAETTDWIAANPLARGVNWACAMDVALRAVSWIWGFHFFAASDACRDPAFRSRFLRALFLHGEFIVWHLEKADINGNHYLCDGVGLVFLGVFYQRAKAARHWLALGRSIVEQEIFQQTTADGVDFEQATAYHRLVLEAFLTSYELLRRHGEPPPDRCWTRLERMCDFVQAYTKPDGRAPLIGDADDGRVQILGAQPITDHRYLLSHAAVLFNRGDFKVSAGRCWEETFWLLGPDASEQFRALPLQSPPGSTAFADGGFYVLRTAHTHLIVDCGDVGMRGRGGHGHNDILSFELFLNGFNLVTDCGAYLYTASREWRNRFRSTAFHNTIQVDDEELNRFLAPDALWQLHDDARPDDPVFHVSDCVDCFRGGHSGYTRLASPVSCTRALFVDKKLPRVLVRDRVGGAGDHKLVWRFHLDPAVGAEVHGPDVCLTCAGSTVWLLPDDTASMFPVSLETGWVSPNYGVKLPNTVVVWRATAAVPLEASYLFAETRLTFDERLAVGENLKKCGAPKPEFQC
jgi:Heparinase II/III-like protein/Heparinase II/III N-terminus